MVRIFFPNSTPNSRSMVKWWLSGKKARVSQFARPDWLTLWAKPKICIWDQSQIKQVTISANPRISYILLKVQHEASKMFLIIKYRAPKGLGVKSKGWNPMPLLDPKISENTTKWEYILKVLGGSYALVTPPHLLSYISLYGNRERIIVDKWGEVFNGVYCIHGG